MYAGYDFESPLVGRLDGGNVAARQTGKNYAGQHHTQLRYSHPSLMRFTSLDPIAASRNLFAYCRHVLTTNMRTQFSNAFVSGLVAFRRVSCA